MRPPFPGRSRVGLCVRLPARVLILATAALAACAPTRSLEHTLETPQQVAEAVLTAFAQQDAHALKSLAVDRDEFRTIVWPRLPAARPERNLTWQYVWRDLSTKSQHHASARLAAWRTSGARVVNVRFAGPVDDHGTFRIHRTTMVDVRLPDGRESTERLCGSMIEQGGRFKVFSYIVD
jgi:hypothetical protein